MPLFLCKYLIKCIETFKEDVAVGTYVFNTTSLNFASVINLFSHLVNIICAAQEDEAVPGNGANRVSMKPLLRKTSPKALFFSEMFARTRAEYKQRRISGCFTQK